MSSLSAFFKFFVLNYFLLTFHVSSYSHFVRPQDIVHLVTLKCLLVKTEVYVRLNYFILKASMSAVQRRNEKEENISKK